MNLPLRRYVIVIQQPVCVSLALALPCILFLGCAVRIIHLRLSEFLRDTQNSATLTSQAPNTKNLEDEDCQPQAVSVSNSSSDSRISMGPPKYLPRCQSINIDQPQILARMSSFVALTHRRRRFSMRAWASSPHFQLVIRES